MKITNCFPCWPAVILAFCSHSAGAADSPPRVPRFSIEYMDKSVDPAADFFRYADGTWVKNNPVPPDKSRWGGFDELQERNWYLIHEILQGTTHGGVQQNSPAQKVGDFYLSAMDTNRIDQLGFGPIEPEFRRIEGARTVDELFKVVAVFQHRRLHAGAEVLPVIFAGVAHQLPRGRVTKAGHGGPT